MRYGLVTLPNDKRNRQMDITLQQETRYSLRFPALNLLKEATMATRTHREHELRTMLCSHDGRNVLTSLLREYLKMPTGQIPVGTPFVETIMNHEFLPGSNESIVQVVA